MAVSTWIEQLSMSRARAACVLWAAVVIAVDVAKRFGGVEKSFILSVLGSLISFCWVPFIFFVYCVGIVWCCSWGCFRHETCFGDCVFFNPLLGFLLPTVICRGW